MGTLIEAIIFDGDPRTAAVPDGLRAVALEAGLTMLPVVHELVSRLDPGAIGDERILFRSGTGPPAQGQL